MKACCQTLPLLQGRRLFPTASHFDLFLDFSVIVQICQHETLPEFAVVGDIEVQQFMDDNVIADFFAHGKQFGIEDQ